MKVKLKKNILRTFIAVVVIASVVQTIKIIKNFNIYGFEFEKLLNIKLNNFYVNFLHFDYDLDHDSTFQSMVEHMKTKYAGDEDFIVNINERGVDESDTFEVIEIPSFYETGHVKPLIQPYDPRFTMMMYLHRLLHKEEAIDFHWADWVDFSKLNKFIFDKKSCDQFDIKGDEELTKDSEHVLSIEDYCKDVKSGLGFQITNPPYQQTLENNEILGKSYVYSSFPPPLKMVLLGDGGDHHIEIKNNDNDIKKGLLYNKYVEDSQLGKFTEKDLLNKYDDFKKSRKLSSTKHSDISEKDYKFNAEDKIKELKDKNRNAVEETYLKALEYSVSTNDPYKYFFETKLLNKYEERWVGEHYDWRFFNGLAIGEDHQMVTLYKLIKNYLKFCHNEGIITWIAHGSLLSWYWNGLIFPWDTDIDVQMPISELHKLSERFNQSLIVEDVNSGYSKYFIDVSSSITHRNKGNGANNIDARFIDVDTGLFIDITGLAITDENKPGRYKDIEAAHCRNNHFTAINEISPLIEVHFEDQKTYIPNKFLNILDYEYNINSISDKNYKDYIYLKNLRIWVVTQKVLDYINDPKKWLLDKNPDSPNLQQRDDSHSLQKRVIGKIEKLQINKLTKNDYVNLIQDKEILQEYLITRQSTSFHTREMDSIFKGEKLHEKPPQFKLTYKKMKDFNNEVNKVIGMNNNEN